MGEAEQQLRRVLREHAADHEHLLDEVRNEWARLLGEEILAGAKTRRHLSALREAVEPFVAVARVYALFNPPLSQRHHPGQQVLRIEKEPMAAGLAVKDFEALLAAHDGAPATPLICNRCCTAPATHEAVTRRVTWKRLCDVCLALDSDPASYVPPDGMRLPQAVPAAPTLTLEEARADIETVRTLAYAFLGLLTSAPAIHREDGSMEKMARDGIAAAERLAQKGAGRG